MKTTTFTALLMTVILTGCNRETIISDDGDTDKIPVGTLERPFIRNNTVYTAWGTKIRGTLTSIIFNYPEEKYIVPNEFDVMLNSGVNTLHIYGEMYGHKMPVGSAAAHCDYLIDEAEKKRKECMLFLPLERLTDEPKNTTT
jgi:hypothetical protein